MITEEQYNLIVASLDKLRRKTINFNCLDKAGTGEDNSNPLTNAHTGLFLPLCLVNEKNPRSYIITGTPPLYEYACLNNQLIDISVKDYTIPNRVSYTYTNHSIEYIRIKHYLFQQIAPIVNQYNCQKNIQINFEQSDGSSAQKEGLYAVLSYNPKAYNNWRNKRKQIHAIVNDILYGFELEGYIYFYDFYRKGNSKRKAAPIAGVQVTFIENNH